MSDISDHAILTTELIWSTFDQLQNDQTQAIHPPEKKKLKINQKMPVNFLESDIANKSLQCLIEKQIAHIENQQQIDDVYKQFLTVFFDELDHLKLTKYAGPAKKRSKSWWCEELQLLWKETLKTEKDLKNAKN